MKYMKVHTKSRLGMLVCVKGRDLLYAKSEACSVLGGFASALEENYYPWISKAASILVPLLKFYTHHEVMKNACEEMYYLLHSAKLAAEKAIAQDEIGLYFKQLSSDIILALGDALLTEPETKVCASMLRELNECLKDEDKTAEERKTCILIFDSIVEHCRETAIKYYKIYLPFLVYSSDDENADLRKTALYGLGLCAEYGGGSFKPYIGDALSKINAVIMHCDLLNLRMQRHIIRLLLHLVRYVGFMGTVSTQPRLSQLG